MDYRERHQIIEESAMKTVFNLFPYLSPERKRILRLVLGDVLEEAYTTGHDDGVELMRDPAYSQEHV